VTSIIKKGTSLAAAVAKDSARPRGGTPAQTETLMMCIDTSGSMRTETPGAKTRMHAAIDAGRALLDACSVVSHVGALAFNDQVSESHDPRTQRSKLREVMGGFHKHEGGTVFCLAVASARLAIIAHPWGTVKRIIFLSDGEDTGDLYDLKRELKECKEAKIIIDTVLFGDENGPGAETLKMMSAETGGIFCLAKDAASLRKTFLALEAGARGLLTSGKK
jgi:Ca-activated chloride channel family protein